MGHLIEWDIRRASFRAAVADLGPIKSLLMRGGPVLYPNPIHWSKWNRQYSSIHMQIRMMVVATSASDVISIDLLELPFTIELLSDEYQGKAIPLR